MRQRYYVLDGKKAVPAEMLSWARAFENTAMRRVAKTSVYGADVSTIFLGLDHGYGDEPPQIFETMVFGGPLDQEMERYSTYEEAERGHAAMVERITKYVQSLRDNSP